MWLISSFEINNVVCSTGSKHFFFFFFFFFFLWIAASVADAAAINPNAIETLLSDGLSTFPIK